MAQMDRVNFPVQINLENLETFSICFTGTAYIGHQVD